MELNEAKRVLKKAGYLVEQKTTILREEINKWLKLLNQMNNVKSHHFEIKGNNTIVEYSSQVGIYSVWTFEKNGEDIDVVVDWPNIQEWQTWIKPVHFQYTLGSYVEYEKDVKDYFTGHGLFH